MPLARAPPGGQSCMMRMLPLVLIAISLAAGGCATATTAQGGAEPPASGPRGRVVEPNADPYPSTYTPRPSRPTLIRNATLLTAAGPTLLRGHSPLQRGPIASVGAGDIPTPAAAVVVAAGGRLRT